MNNQVKRILVILLVVVLVGAGIFVGANLNRWFGEKPALADVDDNVEDYTGDKETYTGQKNTDTIDIPGFDVMNLKAGEKEQKVNLHNPEQNTCYFKMSLYLPDGEKLWESGLVEPGKGLYDITLSEELEAGTYENAVLKYECFTMDESQSPLNGAEIKITINVLE